MYYIVTMLTLRILVPGYLLTSRPYWFQLNGVKFVEYTSTI